MKTKNKAILGILAFLGIGTGIVLATRQAEATPTPINPLAMADLEFESGYLTVSQHQRIRNLIRFKTGYVSFQATVPRFMGWKVNNLPIFNADGTFAV